MPTRSPSGTSPAVDSGAPTQPQPGEPTCLAVDARGISRPRLEDGTAGGACDRGAVERSPSEVFSDDFESGGTQAWV